MSSADSAVLEYFLWNFGSLVYDPRSRRHLQHRTPPWPTSRREVRAVRHAVRRYVDWRNRQDALAQWEPIGLV